MAHIVNFSVSGLAGHTAPVRATLDRYENVFFGLNGSGKTSLLRILHSAMSNDATLLFRVPFESASVTLYSIQYDCLFSYSILKPPDLTPVRLPGSDSVALISRVTWDLTSKSVLPEFQWILTSDSPAKDKGGWLHRYLPINRLHSARTPSDEASEWPNSSTRTDDYLDARFARELGRVWLEYSSGVLTAVRAAQEQGLASILKAVLSPFSPYQQDTSSDTLNAGTAYDLAVKFLSRQGSPDILGSKADFQSRYNKDQALRNVVKDIDAVERKIETAMTGRERLQQLLNQMVTGGKTIKLTDRSIDVLTAQGADIGLAALSSGEKQLLRIVVETLMVGGSSIIIDEPELSMHIDWQRDLLQALRTLNPTAQFIVATHSPEIMAKTQDSNIYRL